MKKILKALVLMGLIFAVLYFGLNYYYSVKRPAPVSGTAKTLQELESARDELSVFEQKIDALRQQGQSFSEEREAIEGLKKQITFLKKKVASGAPAEVSAESPAEVPLTQAPTPLTPQTLVIDRYQMVFLGVIGGLIVLVVFLVLINRLRKKNPVPAKNQEDIPRQPRAAADLKATLEKLRSKKLLLQSGTTELRVKDIQSHRQEPVQPPPVAADPPSLSPASGIEAEVVGLNEKGLDIRQISEKLRIDQDKVRLILRFKQPS